METLGLLTNQPSSSYCDLETDISFVGEHGQTLCGDMGEPFPFAIELGEGTQYPKASDLAGASLPTNIIISNDFRVDVNFSFTGKNVAIAEGAAIDLDQNISFTLDDSNLFACEGMWDGILLDHGCVFTSMNNTTIEDALVAVSVDNKDDVTLDITRTIFNRDLIGIGISNSDTSPNFTKFSRNEFTCSAPLNGTSKQITFAGISCAGGPLRISDSFFNKYNKIELGVLAQGGKVTHSYTGRFDFFENVATSGIFMTRGSVDLKYSQFINCGENGIFLDKAFRVTIENNIFSFDGPMLSLNTNNTNSSGNTTYFGIRIYDFVLPTNISIKGSSFTSNNFNLSQRINGIEFRNPFGRPAKISIFSNVFNINSSGSIGVGLNSSFASSSDIDIEFNTFNFDKTLNGASNRGILVSGGNISNMSIIENDFNATINAINRGSGIDLNDSLLGTNNFVEGNTFSSDGFGWNWLPAIGVGWFDNTKFCNNTSVGGNLMFSFAGPLGGTELVSNTSYWGLLIDVQGVASFISPSTNTGNQYNYVPANLQQVKDANNDATDPLILNMSKFTVHQPQTLTYANFPNDISPFHPKNIIPDSNNEWWVFDSNLEVPNLVCQSQRPSPTANFAYNKVADGSYAQIASFTENWNAEMSLYNILKKDTEAVNKSRIFKEFMIRKSDSNIKIFYSINKLLEQAGSLTKNVDLLSKAKELNDIINTELLAEENLQKLYSLLISKMIRESEFSEEEYTALLEIASQCPIEGGIAVSLSRPLLPHCFGEFDDYTYDCMGERIPEPTVERELAFKIVESNDEIVSHKKSEVFLSPNPISGNQISLSATQAGVLQVFTLEGKLIEEFSFDGSQVLNVENLPTGISFYHVLYSDGDSETGKLIKL